MNAQNPNFNNHHPGQPHDPMAGPPPMQQPPMMAQEPPMEPMHYPNEIPSPNQQAPETRHQATQQNDQQRYKSHHIYGSKGAICFQYGNKEGKPTINIEGAHSSGQRNYNWGQKICLMVTDQELPNLLAVLLGMKPEYVGKHHGPTKDKGFSIKNQDVGRGIFIQVWQGQGNCVSVPVNGEDAFFVTALALSHLAERFPGVNAADLPHIIRATTMRINGG